MIYLCYPTISTRWTWFVTVLYIYVYIYIWVHMLYFQLPPKLFEQLFADFTLFLLGILITFQLQTLVENLKTNSVGTKIAGTCYIPVGEQCTGREIGQIGFHPCEFSIIGMCGKLYICIFISNCLRQSVQQRTNAKHKQKKI